MTVRECANRRCDRPATKYVDLQGRDQETGELRVVRQHVCDEHYVDLTTECYVDGCEQIGLYIDVIRSTDRDGARRDEEVRLCGTHWRSFRRAKIVTTDDVPMIHDGYMRLKALPDDIGHG